MIVVWLFLAAVMLFLIGKLISDYKLISFILAMILFLCIGCIGVCYDNNMHKSNMKALTDFGIEPISSEQVYNTSKAELDKMYSISTLNGTYYYILDKGDIKNGLQK